MDGFECPRCHGNGYELLSLYTGSGLHWMWLLNPVILIHEVILGMRMPGKVYNCVKCDQPLALRQYLHCESCNAFHSWMLWGMRNSVGHWFGLFCPDCGSRIPTTPNLVFLIISLVLTPVRLVIWAFIRKEWIRMERGRTLNRRDPHYTERMPFKSWIKVGLLIGLVSWVIACVAVAFAEPVNTDSLISCLKALAVALVGGALFGLFLKFVLTKRHKFKAGHCRVCGYDLHGLPIDRCPECGFQFDAADRPGDPDR
jgi:hypothetical protein